MAIPNPATSEAVAERILRVERTFAAPRERVFRAWTERDELVKWWGPQGFTVPVCEMDVRVGGAWRTCMHAPDGNDYWVHGEYREVDPPSRLVMTWIWEEGEMAGVETVVTVEFLDRDGGTGLVLTHEGFPDMGQRDNHGQGWSGSFDGLAEIL